MDEPLPLPDTTYPGVNLEINAIREIDERTTAIQPEDDGLTIDGEIRAMGLRVGANNDVPPYNTPNSNGSLNQYGPIDFFADFGPEGSLKTYTRCLMLADFGDPPDLALRRANLVDQDDYPGGVPAPIDDGQNIGTIYWMAWADTGGGNSSFQTRMTQIYSRAVGDQTDTNHGGALHFATAARDTPGNPTDALVIDDTGQVNIERWTVVLVASTTARASLNIPTGVAPTSPVDGDVWQDGTHAYMRIGGVTRQLDN